MNRQTPGLVNAETYDYDIYRKQPRQTADKMQRTFDNNFCGGKDCFYSKQAMHPGTYRVMHRGPDMKQGTKDDISIVDYTTPKKGIKTKRINGIFYERLSSIIQGKKKILKDPESAYRHNKDRGDLERIRMAKKIKNFRPTW